MAKVTGRVTVKGMKEAYRNLDRLPVHVVGPCARRMLNRATIMVQTDAKKNVSTGVTGFLKNDIQTEIDPAALPRWGRVGTGRLTRKYAEAHEKGSKPHWPPPGVLIPWMRHKGMSLAPPRGIYTGGDYYLARHIGLHGTKAHPFLKPAFTKNRTRIEGLLPIMANEIEQAAGKMT